ncbi:MAG: hypothetical protein H7227_08055 [Actinobacteria bacterium]|nr:hypothetical protein [Actinomycetota bacterium]
MGIGILQDESGVRTLLDHGMREVSGDYKPVKRMRVRYILPHIITALVFSLLSLSVEHYISAKNSNLQEDLLVIHGAKTVDAQELRDVVVRNGLTVYWVGAESGYKYLLNAAVPSSISLRYVPVGSTGQGEKTTYREVGTFVSAGAFGITRKAASLDNGVGFVNVDGHAVYYDSRDPTNVYLGLKNKDIQIEVFDPRPDQALAKVMSAKTVSKIR